jgi:hypothetical protein
MVVRFGWCGMRRLVPALVALVMLTGACGDDRRCIRGRHEMILVPVVIGKVTILQPHDTYVCDKRAPRASK